MARFLIDAQLPPALARRLTALGHLAEHVDDVNLTSASDRHIWDYAVDHSAVVITKDEDFPIRKSLERSGPVVIWLRIGNTRKQALLEWFEALLPDMILSLEKGEQLIELV